MDIFFFPKKKENIFQIFTVMAIDSFFFTGFNGLNKIPNIIQFKTILEIINIVPRQPYSVTKYCNNGVKTNVPKPEPHTAIPVASDRYFSK